MKNTPKTYEDFLYQKTQLSGEFGFSPTFMPDFLFPFQRALADAERELADAIERDLPEGDDGKSEIDDYERAADRFAQLVRDEEAAELKLSKQNI